MGFLRDLRYSIRSLSRSPALTAALLTTVAVGIGAHATVAGFINGLLTRNLSGLDDRRLVAISWQEADGDRYAPVPYSKYLSLHSESSSFESVGAFRESRSSVTVNGRSAWMSVVATTPGLWDVLRLPAALGRLTFASEPRDSPMPVVIGYRLWRNEFAGRSDILGAAIAVNGRAGRIVGVTPDWFEGIYLGRGIDLWMPIDDAVDGGDRAVSVLARLRETSTMDGAQEELTTLTGTAPGAIAAPYSGIEPETRDKLARLKRLLTWAAMFVFLTAAANLAGFLLSRAARRSHETAARIALGATTASLASQVVADSVVLSVAGGALGGLVAFWTASALPALLYAEDAERLHLMPGVWQIASSAAGFSALMLVCALMPLTQIKHYGAMGVLQRSGSTSSTSVGLLRSALVIAQMSVCVVLVIGAALLFAGFRQSLRTVRVERLGQPIVAVVEAAAGYGRPLAGQDYFRRVDRDALGSPGIMSTAWIATLPGARTTQLSMRFEQAGTASRTVAIDTAMPPGDELASLTLKEGRPFGGEDGPFSCRVALVNEEMAAEYFDGDALGRTMQDLTGRRVDVIGVFQSAKSPDPVRPTVYLYDRQARSEPSRDVKSEEFRLRPASKASAVVDVDVNVASRTYFDAIGAPFLAGHGFGDGSSPEGCATAVVNKEAAQLYFGGDAVGGAVIDSEGRRAEIVGVIAADVLHVLQRRPEPMVYFMSEQRYVPRMALIAGTPVASTAVLAEVRRRLKAEPGAAPGSPRVMTLEEHLSRTSLGPERIATVLVAVSALISLGLGLLGAYGVMSDSVRQKKREIALRIALGARGSNIVAGVFLDGARIAAAGAVAGLAASWLIVQGVARSNPGIALPTSWMWLSCPLALLAIVAVASILPARWALSVNPLTLLRDA